jgi:hypothetical protein
MEFFLPSLLLMIVAFFVSTHFVPKSSPIVLGVLSLLLLAFTVYNHYSFFANEYRIMTWADTAKNSAPIILVALVIVMMVGYLLFATGVKPGSMGMPSNTLPSANSATNPLTQAINRGLNAAGAVNSDRDGQYSQEELNAAREAGYNLSALNRGV